MEMFVTSKKYLLIFLVIFLSSVTYQASAETKTRKTDNIAGKIIYKYGRVDIKRANQNKWIRVNSGTIIRFGDTIKTGFSGRARLVMGDETMMHIKRNSQLKVESIVRNAGWNDDNIITSAFKKVSRSVFSLIKGSIWARNKNKKVRADFKSVTATIGIRGTELTITVTDDSLQTSVLEGSIEVVNEQGSLVANAGESVTAEKDQALTKTTLLNPLDAVQWTLVVPPLMTFDTIQSTEANITTDIITSIEAKDYATASNTVNKQLSDKPGNRQLQMVDAVLDIYIGEIQSADKKLSALAKAQATDDVLRALALTRLMLGDKESANTLATQAASIDDKNTSNLIIQAYVLQSQFKLEEAQSVIEQTIVIEPLNTTALLILAQLQFGSGYHDEALDTLRSARATDNQSALVENLAGFVLMSKRAYPDANTAFNKALSIDPSLAEPHMGLGIIAMRQGNVKPALEEITTAVALEPQRAIFLSYWGKMLYQIKRFDKALDIFAHAEQIDPNDPTPAFYRSIILRDLNRHGEAIEAMNQAVAKNDNRAVYRSSFLLDEDMATRNVDLSLLYANLGLERWAERKAVSAIKSDYTNYSGHLFLAGVLSDDDDRSYPFTSEALLARMLQPANVNTYNTFNDYTSLFEKPDVGGQVTVAAGNNGSAAGDAIIYGSVPDSNFAYQAGIFGTTTDGWRGTDFEDVSAAAFIGKWQPSKENGVFISTQVSQIRQGDTFYPRYEYDAPSSPDDRTILELGSAEVGYHHNASPGSDFLAYVTWQGNKGDAFTNESELVVAPALYARTNTTSDFERPYYQLQLQYMKKLASHQIITGALGYSGNTKVTGIEQVDAVDQGTTPPTITPVFTNPISEDLDISFISLYVQDTWNISKSFSVEAALYFDRMENDLSASTETLTQDEVNPRIGAIWSPNNNHTIRLAAFRYLLPFVSSRVDPTEVAGISVFRNTQEGTVTEEVNAVWEYERSYGLYSVGAFYLDKSTQHDTTTKTEGNQKGATLGADVLLSRTFGLATNYRYLQAEDQLYPDLDRDDHLLTIGLRHQNANGISAGLIQTYRAIKFDNAREDEDIPITDFNVQYEFADKAGTVGFFINNIFDEQFNWVVDPYVFVGRNPAREFLVSATLNF